MYLVWAYLVVELVNSLGMTVRNQTSETTRLPACLFTLGAVVSVVHTLSIHTITVDPFSDHIYPFWANYTLQ